MRLFTLSALLIGMIAAGPNAAYGQEVAPDAKLHSLGALLDGTAFVRIPAGEFTMGSRDGNADEQPMHRVRITQDFEMGKFEVTQAQWDAVMRDPHAKPGTKAGTPGAANPSHFKGPSRPVESVSWESVQLFIHGLNTRDPKYLYRLPTEAEWEYTSRAGVSNESPGNLDSVAWYEPNSGGETHPVGLKTANAWGVYDIFGNVLEWVQDWYALDYYATSPVEDPQGPPPASYKAYRGGGWHSAAKYTRPAFRGFDFPSSAHYAVGFRLVRTPR